MTMRANSSRPQHIAAFLDRDGTICADVGYCRRLEDFRLLPGVPQAIRFLNIHGLKVVVITNQSGIARGHFTEETLSLIHDRMREQLRQHGAYVDAIYHCPHHPDDDCACRKPKPALLLHAATDLDICLGLSYMIGDHVKDVETGRAAGCRTIWLTTDPGRADDALRRPLPDHIASDLFHAVQWLAQDARRGPPGTSEYGHGYHQK